MSQKFQDPEKFARRWSGPERDAWQRRAEVIDRMGLEPGMTVVDLGAGTGYFVPRLSHAVGTTGNVLALDVSPEMIEYIRKSPRTRDLSNVEARVVPRDDPMLVNGRIDRVLIVNTWHHVTERIDYSRKLAASLAPQGAVVVVDFTLEAEEGPPKNMRLSPEQVASELTAAGLKAVIVEESLPRQYIVVGRRADPSGR